MLLPLHLKCEVVVDVYILAERVENISLFFWSHYTWYKNHIGISSSMTHGIDGVKVDSFMYLYHARRPCRNPRAGNAVGKGSAWDSRTLKMETLSSDRLSVLTYVN